MYAHGRWVSTLGCTAACIGRGAVAKHRRLGVPPPNTSPLGAPRSIGLRRQWVIDRDERRPNAGHLEAATESTFICDPCTPWAAARHEDISGLLRRRLLKGTDLSVYTQDDLDQVSRRMTTPPAGRSTGTRPPIATMPSLQPRLEPADS